MEEEHQNRQRRDDELHARKMEYYAALITALKVELYPFIFSWLQIDTVLAAVFKE